VTVRVRHPPAGELPRIDCRARAQPDRRVIPPGMTSRIGAKGQVVIPKELRDRAGLHPGSEVGFELRDDVVVLTAHRPAPSPAGRFAKSGMATRLLVDRAAEQR